MRFPYQWYETEPSPTAPQTTDLYRPEIPICIVGRRGQAYLFGLLDTGADEILLARSIADEIGADIDEQATWSAEGFSGADHEITLGSNGTFPPT